MLHEKTIGKKIEQAIERNNPNNKNINDDIQYNAKALFHN